MCLAVPMKVISIDRQARSGAVFFSGNEMSVNLSLVSPEIGDYVLVHAGCAIEIVRKDQAEEILEVFETLEECGREP